PTEHIYLPPSGEEVVDVEAQVMAAINAKNDRGAPYAENKTLVVFVDVRWRRKFGQLAKVGSTSMKDGLYDWEAEAVHG
ncbi:MAG: hypothetical protein LPK22_17750, partial [Rhodobacterales bacterium]|nr:hypothetical protein [Rhodobacterales bacterium]